MCKQSNYCIYFLLWNNVGELKLVNINARVKLHKYKITVIIILCKFEVLNAKLFILTIKHY